MIRYEKLAPFEKHYPFEDAVASAEYINGVFGAVSNGKFTAGTGMKCLMQVEKGDDLLSDEYHVKKDEHVRVCDLEKTPDAIVNITKDQLPSTYAKGNKLVAKADGLLKVDAAATKYIEVIEMMPYGVRGKVVIA